MKMMSSPPLLHAVLTVTGLVLAFVYEQWLRRKENTEPRRRARIYLGVVLVLNVAGAIVDVVDKTRSSANEAADRQRDMAFQSTMEQGLAKILDAIAGIGKKIDGASANLTPATEAALRVTLKELQRKTEELGSPRAGTFDKGGLSSQLNELQSSVQAFGVAVDTAVQTGKLPVTQLQQPPEALPPPDIASGLSIGPSDNRSVERVRGDEGTTQSASGTAAPKRAQPMKYEEGVWSGELRVFGGTVHVDLSIKSKDGAPDAKVSSRALDHLVNWGGTFNRNPDSEIEFPGGRWSIRGKPYGQRFDAVVSSLGTDYPITFVRNDKANLLDTSTQPEFIPEFRRQAVCDDFMGDRVPTLISFSDGFADNTPRDIRLFPGWAKSQSDSAIAFWWSHQCAHAIGIPGKLPAVVLAAARANGISSQESLADCFALQKTEQLGYSVDEMLSAFNSLQRFVWPAQPSFSSRAATLQACRAGILGGRVPSFLP